PTAFSQPTPTPTTAHRRPGTAPAVPVQLTDPALGLRTGPVAIPLRLDLPSLGIRATMLGLGILPDDTMDAPKGPKDSPIWDQAFWYRGSAVPGAPSTALIAGHVGGPDGRSAVFGRLEALAPGD